MVEDIRFFDIAVPTPRIIDVALDPMQDPMNVHALVFRLDFGVAAEEVRGGEIAIQEVEETFEDRVE